MNTGALIPSLLNRRAFLRRAASTSLFALSPQWLRAQRDDNKPALMYVTDATEKYAQRPPLSWTKAAAGVRGATIEINSTRQFQPILGFGAALTDASCYLLCAMPAPARHAFLTDVYSPSGLNLNVGRCCIGASDYSRSVYSFDDTPDDMNLDHFSLKHDEAYILPTLREIRGINPALFLMASPWSPPGWMKTYGTTFGGRTTENYFDPYAHSLWDLSNESMLGGWMSGKYLEVYSHYFDKYLKGYAQAGVPVQAVTCQNEIETTQSGKMPACRWSPTLEAAFIRDHLGPLLRAQHEQTQIWLLDHNYNFYQRVATQLEDKQLAKFVDGVAWHGYTGTPDQMSLLHQKDPGVPFHWTEGATFIDDPDYAKNWAKWGGIFTDGLENWCRSAIAWNLVLDPRGKPNLGPFTCGGLLTIKDDGSLLKSGQCHALRHFSRHLQRDGVRIASASDASGLRHVAVRNPDGGFALVVTNPGEARDLRIIHADHQLTFSVPRDAVATIAW
jgi:glucosylceramidase